MIDGNHFFPGYIWDRHYGISLAKIPHKDVVNSVSFNPTEPEMLITVSDDMTIKVKFQYIVLLLQKKRNEF